MFSNLSFKSVSDWTSLAAGQHDMKITAIGKTDALVDTNVTLGGGKYYTLIVAVSSQCKQ